MTNQIFQSNQFSKQYQVELFSKELIFFFTQTIAHGFVTNLAVSLLTKGLYFINVTFYFNEDKNKSSPFSLVLLNFTNEYMHKNFLTRKE